MSRKIIFASVAILAFSLLGLFNIENTKAIGVCSSSYDMNDPACYTAYTGSYSVSESCWLQNAYGGFYYVRCCSNSSCRDILGGPWRQGYWCTNMHGGMPNPSNYASSYTVYYTAYSCHYIDSYTYSTCGSITPHVQETTGAHWNTVSGYNCVNAVPVNWCNLPPSAPTFSTPTACDINMSCSPFSIVTPSTDPEGDRLKYQVNWNNGTTVDASFDNGVFVGSGSLPANNSLSNSWSTSGVKTVNVRACDENGGCSAWVGKNVNVLQCSSTAPQAHSISCTDSANKTNLISWSSPNTLLNAFTINGILRSDCSEGDIKCKFRCDDSTGGQCGDAVYVYKNGSCEPCTPNCCEKNTCVTQTCENSCGTNVPGEKDCRNENWQEVNPN